jgi:hypothetical protein
MSSSRPSTSAMRYTIALDVADFTVGSLVAVRKLDFEDAAAGTAAQLSLDAYGLQNVRNTPTRFV